MKVSASLAAVGVASLILGAPLGLTRGIGGFQGIDGVASAQRRQNGAGSGPPVADGIQGSGTTVNGIQGTWAAVNGIEGTGATTDATAIEYGLLAREKV